MIPTTTTTTVSDQQKTQFHEEGYMILERVIPDDLLQMLRDECHYFMGYKDGQLDERGQTSEGITHRGSRYFIGRLYRQSQQLHRFLFSDVMAEIAMAALGNHVDLFLEQWVIKGPEKGMNFAWHQDSGYVRYNDEPVPHKPYLTCWCTLDDVNEENGTVYLLPHSIAGTKDNLIDHKTTTDNNDRVGYHGDNPGISAVVPAGSVVAFSSHVLHRSGANLSPKLRRVYLAQYASGPIIMPDGSQLNEAVPFVRDGLNVYDHAKDVIA